MFPELFRIGLVRIGREIRKCNTVLKWSRFYMRFTSTEKGILRRLSASTRQVCSLIKKSVCHEILLQKVES